MQAQAVRKEKDKWKELVEVTRTLVRRRYANSADPDGLVGDVLLKIVKTAQRSPLRFEHRNQIYAYVGTVLWRTFYNHPKRYRLSEQDLQFLNIQDKSGGEDFEVEFEAPGFEEAVDMRLDFERLLKDNPRVGFLLARGDETKKELAARFGAGKGKVYYQQKKLRKMLEEVVGA